MDAQELPALALAVFGLLLVATAFGAAFMWRGIHSPRRPPPLPVWVSSLLVAGGAIVVLATVTTGNALTITGMVLTWISFVIHLVGSLRHGADTEQ